MSCNKAGYMIVFGCGFAIWSCDVHIRSCLHVWDNMIIYGDKQTVVSKKKYVVNDMKVFTMQCLWYLYVDTPNILV